MTHETKTYSDGTTAAGPAPLPDLSPLQQEKAKSEVEQAEANLLGMVEDYGQWLWDCGYMDDPRGETLVDDAKLRRDEIAKALNDLLLLAYADGRKDEGEAMAHRG